MQDRRVGISTSLAGGWPFQGNFVRIQSSFYFVFSPPTHLWSIKEPGNWAPTRRFFRDSRQPSSLPAGPQKSLFLASAPHLSGSLAFVQRAEQAWTQYQFGLASQEPCCSSLADPDDGLLGQDPSSCWGHLSWGSFLQDYLQRPRCPQHLAVEKRNRQTSSWQAQILFRG